VAPFATTALEPHDTGLDVELVVDDDEALDRHVEVLHQPGDRAT
jgi:hypothetical protein